MQTITAPPQNQTVMEKLTQPLRGLMKQCKHTRECKILSDKEWVETGITRTLSNESTGRGFIQLLIDAGKTFLKRSHFFETLKSPRRLKFCTELNILLFNTIKNFQSTDDPLKNYQCLDNFDVYAGDGHYHAAAVHDPLKDGKKYPVQHFYTLDLRTHALSHLTQADVSGKRKKEHDMRALKRMQIGQLRQNAPKGKQIIYVWDRAGIDFQQWYRWKQAGGIYFVSREKSNMNLQKLGDIAFDNTDDINQGVQAYEIVGGSNGVSFYSCLLYTSPSPRDVEESRMPSSA